MNFVFFGEETKIWISFVFLKKVFVSSYCSFAYCRRPKKKKIHFVSTVWSINQSINGIYCLAILLMIMMMMMVTRRKMNFVSHQLNWLKFDFDEFFFIRFMIIIDSSSGMIMLFFKKIVNEIAKFKWKFKIFNRPESSMINPGFCLFRF